MPTESSGGAAGHQCSSSAFWEHGVGRGRAGLSPGSESRSEDHRGEFVLPGDAGGSAAGRFTTVITMLWFTAVVFCCGIFV